MNQIIAAIKQLCPPTDYEIGIAALSGLLPSEFGKFPFGISLARRMDASVIDGIGLGPTPEYEALYHGVNHELNGQVVKIAQLLSEYRIEAYPVKATLDDSELDAEYQKTLRYAISHKMIGTRAGIGWIGKTDLLVTVRFGPRVRLASVLVGEKIGESGVPIRESRCGSCNLCVSQCPAHAATGQVWTVDLDRDRFYNAFQCRDYCRKISAERLNKDISICGICLSVCPKGK